MSRGSAEKHGKGKSPDAAWRLIITISGIVALCSCAEEPRPRSVGEFIDNPLLLEAAMVRCAQDRTQSRYDAECVNARQAAASIAAKEAAQRTAELEARSEAKRRALRQTQEAAAEARRRAIEAEQRRKDEEYLSQFGEAPAVDEEENPVDGNVPIVVLPESDDTANAEDD
jgi:hypothetical protein